MIQWQAIVREPAGSLADLANALELEFPDELNQFYGHMFAGSILASVDGHQVELLQAWNEDDFDLLQQNNQMPNRPPRTNPIGAATKITLKVSMVSFH